MRPPCPPARRCGPAPSGPRSPPSPRWAAAEAGVPVGPGADRRDDRPAHDRGGVRGGRRRGPGRRGSSPTSSATCSSRPCSSPSSWRSGARPTSPRSRAVRRTSWWRGTPTSTATPRPTASRVVDMWERRKREERAGQGIFHELPAGLPALAYATKAQRRAAAVGFDFPGVEAALAKLEEETAELREDPGARELGRRAVRRGRGGPGAGRRPRARPAGLGAALPRAGRGRRHGWRPGPGPSSRASRSASSCAGTRPPAPRGRRRDRAHQRVGGAPAPRLGGPRRAPAGSLRVRPGPGRGAGGRRGRPAPRLLEEPGHPRDARPARRAGPAGGASAGASRRCSPASGSTSPRAGRCCTSRCGPRGTP